MAVPRKKNFKFDSRPRNLTTKSSRHCRLRSVKESLINSKYERLTGTLDHIQKNQISQFRNRFDSENLVMEANIYQNQDKVKVYKRDHLTLDQSETADIYLQARKNLSCIASNLGKEGNQQMITFQNEQHLSVAQNNPQNKGGI